MPGSPAVYGGEDVTEPLWPLYDGELTSLDVFYFTSPLATYGLFAFGVLLTFALYRYTTRDRTGEPLGR